MDRVRPVATHWPVTDRDDCGACGVEGCSALSQHEFEQGTTRSLLPHPYTSGVVAQRAGVFPGSWSDVRRQVLGPPRRLARHTASCSSCTRTRREVGQQLSLPHENLPRCFPRLGQILTPRGYGSAAMDALPVVRML